MLIGIDGNEANEERRVGVHQYAYELLRSINKLQDDKTDYVVYLKKPPRSDLPEENKHWRYKIIKGEKLWILKKLTPHILMNKRPDVLFTPSHYLPPIPILPLVCTIHDLGYLKFSAQFKKYDYYQLKYWSAISIYISKYIICPSEFTKKDIVRHYKKSLEKVEVVYHGYDNDRFNRNISPKIVRRTLEKYGISKDYVLFLSTLKPSKNIEGLIQAFDEIKDNIKENLVIAGKKGWLYESIYNMVIKKGLEKRVFFTDYIDEKDKPALIAGARVFVLPSFWEGFGMDVLNALSVGTPVIASKAASIPEVGGDAILYFDPYNKGEIATKLLKVINMDQKRYNMLVEKGFERVKAFSWEKSAEETLAVLKKAATNISST